MEPRRQRYDDVEQPSLTSPMARQMNASKAERLRRKPRPARAPDDPVDDVDDVGVGASIDSAPPPYDDDGGARDAEPAAPPPPRVYDSVDLDARAADLLARCEVRFHVSMYSVFNYVLP